MSLKPDKTGFFCLSNYLIFTKPFMDIKVRLIEILKKENYTFTQLAEYLDMSEEELTNALEQKTLELRSLELISKTLKIPLYSFFREEDDINKNTKPYYINKLWEGNKEI